MDQKKKKKKRKKKVGLRKFVDDFIPKKGTYFLAVFPKYKFETAGINRFRCFYLANIISKYISEDCLIIIRDDRRRLDALVFENNLKTTRNKHLKLPKKVQNEIFINRLDNLRDGTNIKVPRFNESGQLQIEPDGTYAFQEIRGYRQLEKGDIMSPISQMSTVPEASPDEESLNKRNKENHIKSINQCLMFKKETLEMFFDREILPPFGNIFEDYLFLDMIYLESQIYGVDFKFRTAGFLKKQTSPSITSVCRPNEEKKKGENTSSLIQLFPNQVFQNLAGIMALLLRWNDYSDTRIQVNIGTELLTFEKSGKLGGGFYHYIASKMGAQTGKSIGMALKNKNKSPLVRDNSCYNWIEEFQYKMITQIEVKDLCPFNTSFVLSKDISIKNSAFNEVGPPLSYEHVTPSPSKKRKNVDEEEDDEEEDDDDDVRPKKKKKK